MVDFEEYISKINTVDDIDRIKTSDVDRDVIKDMPLLLTFKLQEKIDAINVAYIEDAYKKGRLNEETRDFLVDNYSNTMDKYNVFHSVLMEMNDNKAYGMKFINLKNDERTRIYHENKDPIENSNRFVAPYLPIEIDFKNNYDNFTYLQLPGIKGVERAIEKVEIGGKYDTQYRKECEALKQKYFYNYQGKFESLINEYASYLPDFGKKVSELLLGNNTPDEELPAKFKYEKIMNIVNDIGNERIRKNMLSDIENLYKECLDSDENYQDELSQILKPHERLNDIYRCSKSEVCFEDIQTTVEKLEEAGVEIIRIDDKHSNESPLDEQYKGTSYKGYRDYKLICKAKKKYIKIVNGEETEETVEVVFEKQIKLLPYAKKERETHAIYEEIRVLEEAKKQENSLSEREVIEAEIQARKDRIEEIYEDCILDYNSRIIEMASRMEITELRDKWIDIKSQTLYDSESLKEYIDNRDRERDLLDNQVLKREKVPGDDELYHLVSNKEGKETYRSEEVIDFLRRNLIVSPKKPMNFGKILNGVFEAAIKRKEERETNDSSHTKTEKLLVKDDFRTSRGEYGVQSFMIRYYGEIRNFYIPELRKQTEEDYYNYDKALETVKYSDEELIERQRIEEIDGAAESLLRTSINNKRVLGEGVDINNLIVDKGR